MLITLIVAMSHERGIGFNGALPWRIPEDLRHFRDVTMGHAVLMGRKTYDSIGKPLKGRRNLVLSRDTDFHPEGVEVLRSLDELPVGLDNLFVIGGEKIYREFIDRADRIWITQVATSVEADAFFPEFNESKYSCVADVARTKGRDDPEEQLFSYWFEYWKRLPA